MIQAHGTPFGLPSLSRLILDARRGGFVLRTPFRRRSRSVADTRDLALRVAAWLEAAGMRREDRAILWGPSSPDWVAAMLGCVLQGVPIVPLDDAAGAPFASRVQGEAKARLAFVSRASAEAAGAALGGRGVRIVILEDLAALLASTPPALPADLPVLDDSALLEIVFTSGTTSEPKGVLLTHGNVLSILRALAPGHARWEGRLGWLVRHRPVLTLLPLSHMFGQVVGIFVPLMMGLSSTFVAPQGPSAILEAIRAERCFVVLTVPRFLSSLREHLEAEVAMSPARRTRRAALATASPARRALAFLDVRRALGWRLACFVVGGAALDRDEEMAWRGMGFLITQGYGLTETAPIVTLSNPFARASGRVGKPLHGQEIRLSPEGEVLVRGGNVTPGYLQRGEVRGVTDEEGWFHTGDLGEIDDAGRLRIIGRSKDVIVTAEGLNVHARDVEIVLARDARVRDVAVIGMPGPGGESVHAVLLLSAETRGEPDETAREIVRSANAQLPPYQAVRGFSVWSGADFPRTSATGKVRKRDLAAALAAGATSARVDAGAAPADALATALRAMDAGDGTARLSDLGLSSLETVELVSRLEGEYQVVLDETRVRADMTLAELGALVRATPETAGGGGASTRVTMPRWARAGWARAFGAGLRWSLAFPALAFCCRPFRVAGREHLEGIRGPVLLVGNHGSTLDAPAVFRALPRAWRSRVFTAMATEPFGPLFAGGGTRMQWLNQAWRYVATVLAFGAFPMPRASGFRASLQYAGELADRGGSILIFPEGRMTTDGRPQPFRGGAGILARELSLPVVPFHIAGLHDVLPPDRGWRPRPGPVRVTFGAPLALPAGSTPEEWVQAMESAVWRLAADK